MRKSLIKIITAFMLLVFTPKLGLQLWLHDWFHTEQTNKQKDSPSGNENITQVKCDCIDDFLMPLSQTTVFVVTTPVQNFTILLSKYNPSVSFAQKLFCSLKGPPCNVVA